MHEAYNYLGYTFAEQGKNLDEAIELIKHALELDPDNGAYVDSLGWAYYKKGMYDKALRKLERATKLVSEDHIIRDHLGDVYYKLNMNDKALVQWEKALELDPKQEMIREKIKRLKEEHGEKEKTGYQRAQEKSN